MIFANRGTPFRIVIRNIEIRSSMKLQNYFTANVSPLDAKTLYANDLLTSICITDLKKEMREKKKKGRKEKGRETEENRFQTRRET